MRAFKVQNPGAFQELPLIMQGLATLAQAL
jgi:hypothetical protein